MGILRQIIWGRQKGERVGLFGYVSQAERQARAADRTARAAEALVSQTRRAPQVLLGSLADELTKLAKLRDEGVLTETEFAAQKAKLLGR